MTYLFIIAGVLREVTGRDPNCVAALPASLSAAVVVIRRRLRLSAIAEHRRPTAAAMIVSAPYRSVPEGDPLDPCHTHRVDTPRA